MSMALEKYLDRVMIYANRKKEAAAQIRAEIEDHLLKKIADLEAAGLSHEDAVFQAIEDHGVPWIIGWGLREKKLKLTQVVGWITLPVFAISLFFLILASYNIYTTLSPAPDKIVVLAGSQAKADMRVEGHNVTFLPVEGEHSLGGGGIQVYHWSLLGPLILASSGIILILALIGIKSMLTKKVPRAVAE